MKTNFQNGFVTLEILIAFAIIVLCIGSVAFVTFGNQNLAIDLETSIEAISRSEEMLAAARVRAAADFASLTSSPPVTDGIYEERLDVEDFGNTKKITSNVSWQNGGKNSFVKFVSLVTNLNDSCNDTLSGDWSNPKIINTTNVDLDTGNSLTDLTARSGYAYITADAGASAMPDFYVVDTSDAAKPKIISSLNTGPGLNAVTTYRNFAYVANTSINSPLQVIDLSDKTNSFLVKNFKLPSADSDAGTVGYTIYYQSGKVYLGTKKSGKAGLHIIDVSDLNNLKEVGYFELSSTINQILISGNFAFIASDDSTQELRVLDISDASNIKSVSFYNPPNTSGFGFGKSLAINGNKLFLGNSFDRVAANKELHVLDISNPNINPLPSIQNGEISDSINGIITKGSLVFLATNSTFQARKIADLSLFSSLSLSSAVASMDCSGDYIYLGTLGNGTTDNADVLKIIGASL